MRKQRREPWSAFGVGRREVDNWAEPWKMKRTTIMMDNRKGRAEFGGMDMMGLFKKYRVAWCSENENLKWDEAHCIQGPKEGIMAQD